MGKTKCKLYSLYVCKHRRQQRKKQQNLEGKVMPIKSGQMGETLRSDSRWSTTEQKSGKEENLKTVNDKLERWRIPNCQTGRNHKNLAKVAISSKKPQWKRKADETWSADLKWFAKHKQIQTSHRQKRGYFSSAHSIRVMGNGQCQNARNWEED